jgi:hypothetical protein
MFLYLRVENLEVLETAYGSGCEKIVEVCCRLFKKPTKQAEGTPFKHFLVGYRFF